MTISRVQASSVLIVGNKAPSATASIALTGTTAGNMLALVISWVDDNNDGAGLSNVSDGVNAWNNPTAFGDSHAIQNHTSCTIYSASNIAGGNVTVTMTNTSAAGANSHWSAVLLEYAGVLASAANDSAGNAAANGNSTGQLQCTGGTLTNSGSLAIVGFSVNATETGLTVPSGWSNISGPVSGYPSYGYADNLPGSTTALSPSFGTMGAANNWAVAMAAYKPSGPALQTISVTPAAISLAAGQTQQYTATGHYSDGSTQNLTSTAAWTSSNGSFATISSSGLATAVATGTTTITATSGSISGNTTLAVGYWVSIGALSGTLAGTPPDVETDLVQIQVQDALGVKASGFFTLQVQQGSSTWFGANLPTGPTLFTTTSAPPSAGSTNRGSYYTPGVGGDAGLSLQTAINNAAAATGSLGDVIVLQAGTTYTSASFFNLPARSGSGWIYIISSQAPELGGSGLPAAGTRVAPSNVPNMASLRSSATTQNGYLLQRTNGAASAGAAFYRFVGIDFELTDANAGSGNNQYIISLDNGDTSTTTLAQHMTFDRCYIAGGPNKGVTHALQIDGTYIEVTESWIERVWTAGNADNQAIVGWNGIGPYKITNNWLMAMGEITMWGGSDSSLPSPNMASDIQLENNHYYKPILQNTTGSITNGSTTLTLNTPGYGALYPTMDLEDSGFNPPTGIPGGTNVVQQLTGTTGGAGTYQMSAAATSTQTNIAINAVSSGKNMFEFKAAQRILVNHNYFENAGAAGQARSAMQITARNQSGGNPWNTVSDLTVTNNTFTNAQFGGINMLLEDSTQGGEFSTQPCFRLLIRNNLFILVPGDSGSDTAIMLISSKLPPAGDGGGNGGDLIVDHNTFVATKGNSGESIWFGANTNPMALSRVIFSNNIFGTNLDGIAMGGSPSNYAAALPPQITQGAFVANVMTASSDATIPTGNYRPANDAAVGYTSFGSPTVPAGYVLTGASTYHAKGVTGANLPYSSAGTPDGTDIGCNIAALPTS